MGAGAQGDLVSGIIGGVIFEQGKGGADEFMEDGEDDAHGGFADGAKAVGELLAAWVAAVRSRAVRTHAPHGER